MAAMITVFENKYSEMAGGMQNNFKNKVTEIHVTSSGSKVSHSGGIIYVRYDADWDPEIVSYIGPLFLVHLNHKTPLMLASNGVGVNSR